METPLPQLNPAAADASPRIRVSEIFGPTLQGEGAEIGKPCIFIRLHSCPVHCPGCFYRTTLIRMADGTSKMIDAIVTGDSVLSFDLLSQSFTPRRVTATMVHEVDEIYRLKTTAAPASSATFVTGDHPILVKDKGWVLARNLVENDVILHLSLAEQKRLFNPMKDPSVVLKMKTVSRQRGNYAKGLHSQPESAKAAARARMLLDNPMKRPGVAVKGFLNRHDRGKLSTSEIFVLKEAGDLGLQFVGDGSLVVGGYIPDFLIEGTQKIIEVWDASSSEYRQRNTAWEAKRRAVFEAGGYKVLFLPVTPSVASAGSRKKHLHSARLEEIVRIRTKISEFKRNGSRVFSIERITAKTTKVWARLAGNTVSKVRVHNFEVEGTHTYVADTMIVHNCDTHYTWDGSEEGELVTLANLKRDVLALLARNPGCGIVLSGGEPLIHYRNAPFVALLADLKQVTRWLSLETSGYCGKPIQNLTEREYLEWFLDCFTSVHVSPKVTPCLHGRQADAELLANIDVFKELKAVDELAFKFVVRDAADIAVVQQVDKDYGLSARHRVFLMPYGQEPDEIIETSKQLIPTLAATGYDLSPRLHSIMWGKRRGV